MSAINSANLSITGLQSSSNSIGTASSQSSIGAPTLAEDDFANVLKSMLVDVNQSQQNAKQLAASFEQGKTQDLAGVMVSQQKARLAFQSTLQVRNKLVSAYQDIMNMPV